MSENQGAPELVAQTAVTPKGWTITIPNARNMTVDELSALMARFQCRAIGKPDNSIELRPIGPTVPAPRGDELACFYLYGFQEPQAMRRMLARWCDAYDLDYSLRAAC